MSHTYFHVQWPVLVCCVPWAHCRHAAMHRPYEVNPITLARRMEHNVMYLSMRRAEKKTFPDRNSRRRRRRHIYTATNSSDHIAKYTRAKLSLSVWSDGVCGRGAHMCRCSFCIFLVSSRPFCSLGFFFFFGLKLFMFLFHSICCAALHFCSIAEHNASQWLKEEEKNIIQKL